MRPLTAALLFLALNACAAARRPVEEIVWAGRRDSVLVYASSAFVDERHTLLFGYYPGIADTGDVHRHATFLGVLSERRTGDYRLLPKPAVEPFAFIRPQGMIDRSGTVHVVWAEEFSGLDSTARDIEVRSIWTARLGERGWSEPQRIGVASGLYWTSVSESRVVRSGDGALHIVVPGYIRGRVEGALFHFTLRDGAWSVDPIQVALQVGYASLAASGSNMSLAFISPAPGEDFDRNSVWYMASSDNGRSWGAPVLVSRSGRHAAVRPRVALGPGGVVHLVWAQDYTGDIAPEALRHVQSTDGGRTWSQPVDLKISGDLANLLDASVDRQGRVHALRTFDFTCLALSTFSDGVWTDEGEARSSFVYLDGGYLVPDSDGELTVVWTGIREVAPGVAQLAWLRTRLAHGARRPASR